MNHTFLKLIKRTFLTQNPLEGHFDIFVIVRTDTFSKVTVTRDVSVEQL